MGCWNETCRLSNLPITVGDKVVAILLYRTSGNEQTFNQCYYNTNYAPLCLPIVGKYNDYGSIEKAEASDCTMKLLNSLKIADEKNTPYTITTIEEFVDKITSSQLFWVNGFNEKHKLECAFYHKKLYDTIVSEMSKEKPCNNGTPIAELYAKMFENFEKKFSEFEKKNQEDLKVITELWSVKDAYRDAFKVSHFGFSFISETAHILEVNELRKFHKELINYIMFTVALDMGRYGFDTVSGAGSQNYCVLVQRIVAKFILEFTEDNKDYTTENDIYWR